MNDPERTGAYQPGDAAESTVDSVVVPPFVGRYRVERILGQGGFGLVYLAHDDRLQRLVAIKVPHRKRAERPETAEASLAEARTVANLDHPHIVPVYDVGSGADCPLYIVSKYIDGLDLAARLKQGRLTLAEAIELTANVAEALQHAHQHGLVHRDVKPGNLLLDKSGKAFVTDFGVALRDEDVDRAPRFAGTLAYMSPEQARGEGHRVDGRSDIFSLGVVLYELITGRRPFRGATRNELIEQIGTLEPPPPRQFNPEVPREVERIVSKALAKLAAERYPSAQELADDLRHFLNGSACVVAESSLRPTRAESSPSTVAPAASTVPSSESTPIRIVPKGLRSFDAYDADFFLELLPGPRDRAGLPDSVRFWKQRVEDGSFAVGLIYGPTGCGKSSLVKAGLLPRLSERVLVVYVESTAQETEARLLDGLRRRCPTLPGELGLKDALTALRRGQGAKVLLVLDQFEQWLHAQREEQPGELIQALRQCDGARVQCLVMVRDDFWLAVSRFLRQLEVRLVEGQNCAFVDLFPARHARKVLAAFGRAFGTLPDNGPAGEEQAAFLDRAIAGLAQEDKVTPVRLALFAEMMKARPWTPAALQAVGGARGIGTAFLEETFSAATAPPAHRQHQQAARGVLQALLPEPGTDIKGHLLTQDQLLTASGYESRRGDFEDLLRILDSEVRLITPTASEGTGQPCYQLTHDYLVPSLRDWLTRKQKETRRGRAELLLADQAALWAARPENRQLPSLPQWLGIRWLTRPQDWTPPQQDMMRQAGRYHLRRGMAFLAVLLVVLGAGWEWYGRLRAQTLRDNLFRAPTEDVPAIIADMGPYRRWLAEPLRQAHADAVAAGDARKQLHASLALLPTNAEQESYLLERLLVGSPTEVVVIRAALGPRAETLNGRMWQFVENRRAESGRRLRAACFLAAHASEDNRWHEVSADVVECLARENTLELREWVRALRPLAAALLAPLANLVAEQPLTGDLRTPAGLYSELAGQVDEGFAPLEKVLAEQAGTEDERVGVARRRATAAAALAAAGRWERVLPLLRHNPDATVRSYLIQRLAGSGADPAALLARLSAPQESGASIRQALLLALGDFGPERLPERVRAAQVPQLVELYRDDADAGIRAAAGWLLRQWDRQRETVGPDRQLSTGRPNGRRWYLTGQGQTMVLVPPGVFALGEEDSRNSVRIEYTFALAAREVTVAEFLRFRQDHRVEARSAPTADCPVNEVTWYDAAAYCNWLSKQEGIAEGQWCYVPNEQGRYAPGMKIKADALALTGYRLPTTAEWEHACRAGSTTRWSLGAAKELLDRYCWSANNAGVRSHPVGVLRPNDLGLFDMHGNVWEWCQDRLDAQGNPETTAVALDDRVEDRGRRPLRGGTFLNDPPSIHSGVRNWNAPSNRSGADGFRPARTLRQE